MNYEEIVATLHTNNPPTNLIEKLTKAFHSTFPDLTYKQAKDLLLVVGIASAIAKHPKRATFKAEALAYLEAQTQDSNKINHLLVVAELMSFFNNLKTGSGIAQAQLI